MAEIYIIEECIDTPECSYDEICGICSSFEKADKRVEEAGKDNLTKPIQTGSWRIVGYKITLWNENYGVVEMAYYDLYGNREYQPYATHFELPKIEREKINKSSGATYSQARWVKELSEREKAWKKQEEEDRRRLERVNKTEWISLEPPE